MFAACDYISELEIEGSNVDIDLPRHNVLQAGGFRAQYERCHPVEPFDLMLEAMKRYDSPMAQAADNFFSRNVETHALWAWS